MLVLAMGLAACRVEPAAWTIEAGDLTLTLDARGLVTRAVVGPLGNVLREPTPLLSLGEAVAPDSARLKGDAYHLYFGADSALVRIRAVQNHLSLTLESAPNSTVAIWGPYPTRMDDMVGETVGVVHEQDWALGIQALNARTLGGYPWQDNDLMPQTSVPLAVPTAWGDSEARYRSEAARPDEGGGSSLQAYVRDRSEPRVIENRGFPAMEVEAVADSGLPGSAVALFAKPSGLVLDAIEEIELAHGLPHPLLDGVWVKRAGAAGESYVVLEFDEERLGAALDMVQQAGLRYLYHEEPFSTWGRFTLDPKYFPDGEASLERMVRRAGRRGIMLGLHTLSNFVTPNDPMVTPVPSAGLKEVGGARLGRAITSADLALEIDDPTFFPNGRRSHLGAARIGDELVRFDSISSAAPWRLLGVQRGAFGTQAMSHDEGVRVSRIDDHAYRVFLTNLQGSQEIARTLAGLMRRTGVRGMGFDGLGGVHSSGHGKYAENLFVQTWWDHLGDDLQSHSINSGSGTTHWYWHLYSRMNWGEPWRGGFREAQLIRRLRQQDYYRRNLMAPMLGWFKMTPVTTLEDVEWMLARAAGFDAGFAFVTIYETLEQNAHTAAILSAIRTWESARLSGAFPESLREHLQDVATEFRLARMDSVTWELTTLEVRIAGPGISRLSVPENLHDVWIMAGSSGTSPLTIEVNGTPSLATPGLAPGARLVWRTGGTLEHHSPTGALISTQEAPLPVGSLAWTVALPGGTGPEAVRLRAVTDTRTITADAPWRPPER